MATFNSHMFYLGNYADMDPNETNTNAEQPGNITAFHTQPPLVAMTVVDGNDDGAVSDDELVNSQYDTVSYDLGAGPTTQFVDSTILYGIEVTLGDGTSFTTQAVGIQMQNGDVFLTELNNNGSLDGLAVQNIRLLTVDGSDYGGFFADQSVDNTRVVCFAAGTPVVTPSGEIPVEDIRPGMAVLTRDGGAQPCLYASSRFLLRPGLQRPPVLIAPGALGAGLPRRRLSLSPQHRVALCSPVARRMSGCNEVLIPAKDLLGLPGVTRGLPFVPMRYVHLMFARHELLATHGIWSESLLTGPEARKSSPDDPALSRRMRPVRPILSGKRARRFLRRHLRGETPTTRPLCAPASVDAGIGALPGKDPFEPAGFIQ